MTDASKPLFTIEDSLSALEYAAEGRVNSVKPDLLANYINRKIAARDADLIREAQAEAWQQAIESQCDFCGGRLWDSPGKEIPFQVPNDNNWYHRIVSPCRAANLHNSHPDPTYRERIEAQARQTEAEWWFSHQLCSDEFLVRIRANEAEIERLKPTEGKSQ